MVEEIFQLARKKNVGIATLPRGFLTPSKWKIYQVLSCSHGMNQCFHKTNIIVNYSTTECK